MRNILSAHRKSCTKGMRSNLGLLALSRFQKDLCQPQDIACLVCHFLFPTANDWNDLPKELRELSPFLS